MALSEIYVDPSIGADSGAGTIGDPYGDLEYAIEQTTFDTTNGTRVNVRAGTDEVLASNLEDALADTTTTVAWVPSRTAPLVIQGYTSAAGDGGIGGISGGGSVAVFADGTIDYLVLADMHCHNVGANSVLNLDNWCSVMRCEVNNSTGGSGIEVDNQCVVTDCYIHNVTASGITSAVGGFFSHNYISDCDVRAILVQVDGAAYRNIISTSGSQDGIMLNGNGGCIVQNSIYSAGGTGQGIVATTASTMGGAIMNNLVEGFSGSGGIGIQIGSGTTSLQFYAGNSVYNCATAYSVTTIGGEIGAISGGSNETLSASPFTSAGTGNFSPVDTGSVKEGVIPATIGSDFLS